MEETSLLKINPIFQSLIRPLYDNEYKQLEQNIIKDGCLDPIVIWNGYIIDGHNRYNICKSHGLPFKTVTKEFQCQEEAIAWICANQLGRRNISDETRIFLIGKQYEAEKCLLKNPRGINQYGNAVSNRGHKPPDSNIRTAKRIAAENHISSSAVEKYAKYSQAMDVLVRKDPGMAANILSGKYKVSQSNVIEMAKLPPSQIKLVGDRIESLQQAKIMYSSIRSILHSAYDAKQAITNKKAPSVKDMPAFDPDAEVVGLTLTIPSWRDSISRIRKKTDLNIVSYQAKAKLTDRLYELRNNIDELLNTIGEL